MHTPFAYQQDGIEWLIEHGPLLADDPGCGKTLQTVEAWKSVDPDKPSIVFCPSVVTGVWGLEILAQAPDARILVLNSKNYAKKLTEGWDWIICSVDLPGRTAKVYASLRKFEWGLFVVDEAHFLKNRTAKRTRTLIGNHEGGRLSKQAEKVIYLTGTPTPNNVSELWPLIVSTKPQIVTELGITKYQEFEDRFCTHKMVKRPGRGGKQFEVRVIAGNNRATVPTLMKQLDKHNFWLRRRKQDVLDQLPSKFRRVVPLTIGKLDPELDELLESKDGLRLKRAIETGNFEDVDAEFLSRFMRLMALAKAEGAADYIQHLIDNEGKPGVTVWFWHTEAMNRFQKAMEKNGVRTLRIDGSTPQNKRAGIVADFQSDGGPKVFIGQIKAAGTGITLTKATHAVFVEAYWTPGDNAQAEDRIYRIGQTQNVQIDYLAVMNSLDMVMQDVIAKKTADWEMLEESALQTAS